MIEILEAQHCAYHIEIFVEVIARDPKKTVVGI